MELKTLNDFLNYGHEDGTLILATDLKNEAINWIKESGDNWTPKSAFMDFFNITEEDLLIDSFNVHQGKFKQDQTMSVTST